MQSYQKLSAKALSILVPLQQYVYANMDFPLYLIWKPSIRTRIGNMTFFRPNCENLAAITLFGLFRVF